VSYNKQNTNLQSADFRVNANRQYTNRNTRVFENMQLNESMKAFKKFKKFKKNRR